MSHDIAMWATGATIGSAGAILNIGNGVGKIVRQVTNVVVKLVGKAENDRSLSDRDEVNPESIVSGQEKTQGENLSETEPREAIGSNIWSHRRTDGNCATFLRTQPEAPSSALGEKSVYNSELVEVISEDENWIFVRTLDDGSEGYLQRHHLVPPHDPLWQL